MSCLSVNENKSNFLVFLFLFCCGNIYIFIFLREVFSLSLFSSPSSSSSFLSLSDQLEFSHAVCMKCNKAKTKSNANQFSSIFLFFTSHIQVHTLFLCFRKKKRFVCDFFPLVLFYFCQWRRKQNGNKLIANKRIISKCFLFSFILFFPFDFQSK